MRSDEENNLPPLTSKFTRERTKRVLIVDDNIDAGEMLSDLLSILGYSIVYIHRSPLALSCLDEFKPDICISDLNMPEMDGYEFARSLRANPQCKKTFLIALSAHTWPEHREAAIDAGFDEHLSKSVDVDCLLKLIGPALFFTSTD